MPKIINILLLLIFGSIFFIISERIGIINGPGLLIFVGDSFFKLLSFISFGLILFELGKKNG